MYEREQYIYCYTWSSMKEKNHTNTEENVLLTWSKIANKYSTVYYDILQYGNNFLRSCEKNFKNVGVNFSTSGLPESFMDFCQTIVWKIYSKFSFSVIWISKYLFAFLDLRENVLLLRKLINDFQWRWTFCRVNRK